MNHDQAAAKSGHRWRFSRVGGIDMVRIETAADLQHIEQLDEKLWTALACPVKGLEFDEQTLALIDTDKDGRVRVPEVIAAVKWACGALKDPGLLFEIGDTLPLAVLADAELAVAARDILSALGQDGATTVSLNDALTMGARLAKTPFNGDGVVTVDSAGDDAPSVQLINDIIATQSGVPDRSGKPGVDAAKLAAFYEALTAFDAWTRKGESDAGTIRPLGDETPAAWDALQAVRTKMDDFFGRCRLAAFDPRATGALNRQESEFIALAVHDLSITADEIKEFPLAHVEPGRPLPLVEGINPAWSGAMTRFRAAVVEPLLGKDAAILSDDDWGTLKKRLAPYGAWVDGKAGASVESLGIQRVRTLLGGDERTRIEALLAEDTKVAPRFDAVKKVEKILRFNRDIVRLLHNFVAFTDFFDPSRKSVFQAGTLYLDGRSCNLVLPVTDSGKHATLAGLSKMYLAYCKCTRPSSSETREVVAAITNGDSDHLMPGRNGLFYDRKGRDWDAEVVKVVDNPVSLRQAFFTPYKKFVRMLEEQATKRAMAAEAASEARMAETATAAVSADKAPPPPGPKKIDVGTVAALGVAASAMVAVLTALISGILGLVWWQIPLAVIGVLLFISGPSLIIAALKLRLRTLGPLLDANGWAINGRLKINIPFGRSLTTVAALPKGAERTMNDPFADRKTPRLIYIGILLVLAAALWGGVMCCRNRSVEPPAEPIPEEPAADQAPE